MRHLGIDYGRGKVGLALSDEAGTMGFPKTVLQNDATLMKQVATLVKEEGVGAVVIGDASVGGRAGAVPEEARAFGARLAKETGIPVFYEMEAFSTQEARRAPDGTRGSGAVDAAAAALILTSYLSRPHD